MTKPGHHPVDQTLEALLKEDRLFPPPPDFQRKAWVNDAAVYDAAESDYEGFWANFAGELEWSKPWDAVLEGQLPYPKWFVGGQLNASVNCLDRHVSGPLRNKAALIWFGRRGFSARGL